MITRKTMQKLCEEAKQAGKYQMSWTDQEVVQRIRLLNIVISYLNSRKDSNIIVKALRQELSMHEGNARVDELLQKTYQNLP